jgi:hypothetical protein
MHCLVLLIGPARRIPEPAPRHNKKCVSAEKFIAIGSVSADLAAMTTRGFHACGEIVISRLP